MKSKPNLFARATCGCIATFSLSLPDAHAANKYWDFSNANGLTAGSGVWGTDNRWAASASPGTAAPGAWATGDAAFFQTGGTNTVSIAAGGVSAISITQTTNNTATTLSSGGGTVTVTGTGGIVNSGNQTFTINSGLILGGTNTYTFNAGSTITVGGSISQTGTAGINKTGNSVLNLNAANSYSGGTTVAAGRLIVGASGTLGTNVATNNISVSAGGQLGLSAASNVGSTQTVSINSSSTALGGFGVGYSGALPTLDTSGTTTFGGIFGINYTGTAGVTSLATLSSTLNTGGASGQWFLGAQGTGTFNGSTLAAASDSIYRLGGGGGSLTFNQTNVLTGANEVQIGSTSTGGGGTVILGAAQNYTGATTVNGGTLKLGHAGSLGDATTHTSGVTVNGAAIFDLGGISPTYNAPLVLNSTANGFDVGSLSNSVSTAVTFGGAVNLQAATVRVGSAGSGGGNITLTGAITGNGKNFIKDSSNVMTLSNSGTVSLGTLQIYRGTLQLNSGTTLNPSGNFTLGGGSSVGSSLTMNGGLLTVTSGNTATFGSGSGTGSTLTLTGGTLTVPKLTMGSTPLTVNFNGGTLKANAASTTFLTGAVNGAKVQAGGAFIDDGGNDITIGQALNHDTALVATSDGGLTKSGVGILTLSGANTYTGATTISEGTLKAANASALGFGGLQSTVTNGTTVASGYTLDLNGTTGINEPIILNGTGIGGNGALVNNSGTAATIGNGIAGATFASGGSGYSAAPTIAISGTGTGATATASLGLTTDSITTATGGTGWVTGDTVNVTGGGGSGAIGTVTASGGAITSIAITTAGSGYTAAPTGMTKLSSAAGAGTLTLTGNATNFTVSAIAMTAAGSGYTGTPTYTFSGGSATPSALTLSSVTLASDSSIGGTGDINISAVVGESAVGKSLTKVGAGTLTLSGAATYTGATTISQGKLMMGDDVGDTFATSGVTVDSGATLGGSGTITNTVGVTGILAPGIAGIGTLTADDTTWNGAASSSADTIWQFDLSATSSASDTLAINGDFKKDSTVGTVYKFDFMNSAPTVWGNVYTLVTWTGATDFTDADQFSWTNLGGSYDGQPGTGFTLNANSLTFTAVPEPTSALAGLLITAGLLRRRRSA